MRTIKLAVALAFSIAACQRTPKVEVDPATGRTDIDIQKPGVAETWNANITSVGGSTVSGTAKGTTMSDMTHVTVTITGGTPGATYPWHVHDGKCTDAGPPIVGSMTDYPPLVVASNGTATATANLSTKLNEAKNYIINIHASPTNMGTIIACGDYND